MIVGSIVISMIYLAATVIEVKTKPQMSHQTMGIVLGSTEIVYYVSIRIDFCLHVYQGIRTLHVALFRY